jgi:heme A synthase
MNWSKWIRQFHRWLTVALTLAVLVNFIAVVRGKYTAALGLLAVFPLALLAFTGLYLFMLPYVVRWRSYRRRV